MKQEALLNKKIAIKKIESKILYDDKQDIINDNDIEMTNDHCHSDIIIDIIDTIYFPIKDTLLNYNKENDYSIFIHSLSNYINNYYKLFELFPFMNISILNKIEIIYFSYIIFVFTDVQNDEDKDEIRNLLSSVYEEFVKIIMMLSLLYSNKVKKPSEDLTQLKNMSMDYFKSRFKPNIDRISILINDTTNSVINLLLKTTEFFVNYINRQVDLNDNKDLSIIDELNYFKKTISILSSNCLGENNLLKDFKEMITLLNKKGALPYFLPPMNSSKYKYTLVLDLDNTLIRSLGSDIIVRPFAEEFIKELSKYYEIVIFTGSEQKTAESAIKKIDKDMLISYLLDRRYLSNQFSCQIKDLSKIGRDLRKTIIVDDNECFVMRQKENGIIIKFFGGELNDKELFILCKELIELAKENKEDIRFDIQKINSKFQKRYEKMHYI